ncbi:MAG: hypothetical protein ABIR11_03705 [Candidatus Limnocylindrales bacterium]
MAGVMYRGFSARTELVRWGLAAVAIGIVVAASVPAAIAGLMTVLEANRAALPWLFERLFAFLAYGAMAGSMIYGLLMSTKILDAIAHRPISFALHQDLAAIGVGLAGIHGILLGLDRSVPFSLAQIVVPGLSPHAPIAVAFGQVGLYLAVVVVVSFYLRRRIGQKAWRALHYLTFLSFVFVTVHGIASGTDSGRAWAQGLYIASAAIVAFLMAYRIALSVAGRRAAPADARVARPAPAALPQPLAVPALDVGAIAGPSVRDGRPARERQRLSEGR